METFRIDGQAGHDYRIRVEEVTEVSDDLVRTLIEIDLQTFSESTFSHYTAAAFLRQGGVFLMRADDVVIGTCACIRSWDRPNEAMILSMGIRPGWRGRGLGQRFVQDVLAKLRHRGLRAVTLLVGADNRRAVKVYEDVGFETAESCLEDPRTGETFLLMRQVLQQATLAAVPDVRR